MCAELDLNLPSNFIYKIVERDLEEGVCGDRVCTRFPPEPNGYLHIGNAYAINISYSVAQKYNGKFHLRFDDTNPDREDIEYVEAIKADMKWAGFNWGDCLFFGSDYSDMIYECAVKLIKKGKAYVCDLTPEELKEYRGTLTEPGKESPYRNRTVEENLELFERMKKGEFLEGSRVLRAKIDMTSPNINLRDPVMYRIQYKHHYRTGDRWCIYPMYDFAHPLQDAIEKVTHSLCSAEFKDHRPLYEWFLAECEFANPPRQREFGRMGIKGVVTSKRYLRELVEEGYVDGWDDPRMPTLRGLRRRGYTPESLRNFLGEIGVSKGASIVDSEMLEHSLRQDLITKVPRVMAVLNPLKVVITNFPEGEIEWLDVEMNEDNPELGYRKIPFSRELYIEQEDFMENPSKKFRRLSPGVEVRLMHGYFIRCNEVIKNEATGEILELRCTYDPVTKSGSGFSERKPKGTIHWVAKAEALRVEVRLYEKFLLDDRDEETEVKDWKGQINPNSLIVLKDCYVEPVLKNAESERKFQFVRHGFFCVDMKYSTGDSLVFNRTVSLKSSWKK